MAWVRSAASWRVEGLFRSRNGVDGWSRASPCWTNETDIFRLRNEEEFFMREVKGEGWIRVIASLTCKSNKVCKYHLIPIYNWV